MLDRIGEADVLTWSQHVSLGVSHLGWTSSPGPPFACAVLGEANCAKKRSFFRLRRTMLAPAMVTQTSRPRPCSESRVQKSDLQTPSRGLLQTRQFQGFSCLNEPLAPTNVQSLFSMCSLQGLLEGPGLF